MDVQHHGRHSRLHQVLDRSGLETLGNLKDSGIHGGRREFRQIHGDFRDGSVWIIIRAEPGMLSHWADWFCAPAERHEPLVSPILADLCGLPPIYVQAGRCEILYDSIQAFVDVARSQRADVTLDVWADMNHDFPLFGPDAPQSAEALRRIGEVIAARLQPQEMLIPQPVGQERQ